MHPFNRILYFYLAMLLSSNFLVSSAAGQTMGAMDSHTRPRVRTEKLEIPSSLVCPSFRPTLSSGDASDCDRIRQAIQKNRTWEAGRMASGLIGRLPLSGLGDFWLGLIELREGECASGVRHLEKAVERNPELPLVHVGLALGFLAKGEAVFFEQKMRWVIERFPRESLSSYFLGRYYSEVVDRSDEGAGLLLRALSVNPEDFRPRFHLGLNFEMKGDFPRAREEYLRASAQVAAQQETYAYPLEGLARLDWKQQNPAGALRYARQAVSLDPQLPSSRLMLGNLFLQTGDTVRSISELKAAAELDPADAAPHYMLARAYRKMKKLPEAQREEEIFSRLKRSGGEE